MHEEERAMAYTKSIILAERKELKVLYKISLAGWRVRQKKIEISPRYAVMIFVCYGRRESHDSQE